MEKHISDEKSLLKKLINNMKVIFWKHQSYFFIFLDKGHGIVLKVSHFFLDSNQIKTYSSSLIGVIPTFTFQMARGEQLSRQR